MTERVARQAERELNNINAPGPSRIGENLPEPTPVVTPNRSFFSEAHASTLDDRSRRLAQVPQVPKKISSGSGNTINQALQNAAHPGEFYYGMGKGVFNAAKDTAGFVSDEVSRLSQGQETQTKKILRTGLQWSKDELSLLRQNQPTQTEQAATQAKTFMIADFQQFKSGQATKTGAAAERFVEKVGRTAPSQAGELMGEIAFDYLLTRGIGGVAASGAKTVYKEVKIANKVRNFDKKANVGHIFPTKAKKRHLPDTIANRKILIKTCADKNNFLGKDQWGNMCYAQLLPDGR